MCEGCERRYVGCHSTCPDYSDFRMKIDAIHKAKVLEDVTFTTAPKPKRHRESILTTHKNRRNK